MSTQTMPAPTPSMRSISAKAYAAQSATSPLTPHAIQRRLPTADDVAINILYCGVCHYGLAHGPQRMAEHGLSVRAGA